MAGLSISSAPLRLTAARARSIALAAAGFNRKRPARAVRASDIAAIIRRLGLIQLDFVNVLVPAHYTVIFSRLGPYPRELFDRAVYGSRDFTEQWAHVASIIPVETWPLLRHRFESRPLWANGFDAFAARHPTYCDWVMEQIRRLGPLTAADLQVPDGVGRRLAQSWFGTIPRAALELLFARGKVAAVNRLPDFSRVYDLAERALPPQCAELPASEAKRELVLIAARAMGVSTAADLADYFRMPVRDALPAIAELVRNGLLQKAAVDGWSAPAYLHTEAERPRQNPPTALLAPFDPLIWYRPRALRVFGFDYRLEIFVPAAKRRWGAWVLPFLFEGGLAARVDLKALRDTGTLAVKAAYVEPGAAPERVAAALATELRLLAGWLGLPRIAPGRRGNLAAALRKEF
jgi:uncharacterized protein YcaQ